jgi:hypothetical protein
MRGPEIPASVGTHLEAGFRLPNKHEHLDETVGQVAIDGLAFETPAPPAFVDMPFEIYDVRKVGTVRDGLLFQQGKSSRAGASPINPYKCRQSLAAR